MDGLSIAIEELAHVGDAAVPQLESFDRSIQPLLPFVEGAESKLHGLFDNRRILGNHGGIPAKRGGNSFSRPPNYHSNRMPKRPIVEVNKFLILS